MHIYIFSCRVDIVKAHFVESLLLTVNPSLDTVHVHRRGSSQDTGYNVGAVNGTVSYHYKPYTKLVHRSQLTLHGTVHALSIILGGVLGD